jgi:hypothetical protein
VEDWVSAIKVARVVDTSPVMGSKVGMDALFRASRRYKRLGIWLDSDMELKARREALRASSVGLDVSSVLGIAGDPKDYSTEAIRVIIQDLFSN